MNNTAKVNQNCLYKPGSTSIQTTTYLDEFGVERCHYTDGKTVEEYITEHPGCVLMDLDEAVDEIRTLDDYRFIKPFSEITEEVYNEMLEVLPPQKWQTVDDVNIFRMMEYTCGNITAHYVSYNGKFYSAERRTTTPYSEIAKEIKAL